MMESKLTIACYSTMLRENIALGKSFKLQPNTYKYLILFLNICALKNLKLSGILRTKKLLLNMSEQAYLNELGNDKENYL